MKTSLVIGLMLVGGVASAESLPGPVDLGTLGGPFSSAADINEKDQVAGTSTPLNDGQRAFLWQRGRFTDLGTLGGYNSRATALNKHGDVVGASEIQENSFDEVAFVWRGGALVKLGALPGDSTSEANDINDRGDIVGRSGVTPVGRAVIWKNGRIEALPAPGTVNSVA